MICIVRVTEDVPPSQSQSPWPHRDVPTGKAGAALPLRGPGLPHPLSLRGLQVGVAHPVVDQAVVDEDVGLLLGGNQIYYSVCGLKLVH